MVVLVLQVLVIPSGVTSIGEGVFDGCTGITSIEIPSGVTSIDRYTFNDCSSLTSCTIGNGVTSIGDNVFTKCTSLTSINIPSGVTRIGDYAFRGCSSLTSIVSNAVTAPSIYRNTFQDIKTGGILTVPISNFGYNLWMSVSDYYLGKYGWTKVEQ